MTDETRDETTQIDLPLGIAAAWGIRERPGKGPRPGLSVRRIVQAAIRTALEEGLDAVSMNRVASRLGTAAMSLYRYVAAKDELVALMVDEANGPPPDPPDGMDWREALAYWAQESRARYRAHPWQVHVPISGPPILPNGVAWFERWLRSLAGTPLTEDEKVAVVLLLSGMVRNYATLEAQLAAAARRSADSQRVMQDYGQMLARLADERRFPALHAAIAAGAFDDDGDDPDGDGDGDDIELGFDFSLERVLDGIAAFIAVRGAHQVG